MIQINVKTSGLYTFISKSTTSPDGHLYEHYFHPFNPSKNLLFSTTDNCPRLQFSVRINISVNQTYALVVTSYHRNEGENIYIIAIGPDTITFNPISKFQDFRSIHYFNRSVQTI